MNKNNLITVLSFIVICGLLVGGLGVWLGGDRTENDKEAISNTNEEFIAPLSADELAAYQVTMTNDKNPVAVVVTNEGTFKLELFEDTMPITTGNFIKLAEEEFYNGVQFHRVIPGFMIQGGDPITKTKEYLRYGTGGPDHSIPDEHIVGKYLTNLRGTISMANSGPNSGGSQFFINVADNTNLDFDKHPFSSKHPVFGRIVDGMDTIDAISLAPTNDRDLPIEPIVIQSITITRS